jgi:long-subunit fatty acid transport protein
MRSTRLAPLALALAASAAQAQTSGTNFLFATIAEQSRTAFTIQGTGSRAVGVGGAFVALADDATAVSFNPAGLAQLLAPEFSLVTESLQREQTFRGFKSGVEEFGDTSSRDRRLAPLFFSATVPFKAGTRTVVVTFAYQRVVDFNFDSDRNLDVRPSGVGTVRRITNSVSQDGAINVWSLGMGTEVTPRLLVGASLNLWRGEWNLASRQSFDNSNAFFDILQDNQFRGVNVNAGVLWRSDRLNVGLSYRSGFRADYRFDGRFAALDEEGRPVVFPAQKGQLDLTWPDAIGLGLAWKPHDRFTVTADSVRTRWSGAVLRGSFTTQGESGPEVDLSLDGANFFDYLKSSKIPDTKDLRGGVEWIAFLGDSLILPLRAGYFREPQPLSPTRMPRPRTTSPSSCSSTAPSSRPRAGKNSGSGGSTSPPSSN